MDLSGFGVDLSGLAGYTESLAKKAHLLAQQISILQRELEAGASLNLVGSAPFLHNFTIFVLAVFIGYYVVWRVTPALHSPLMSVTNAISSVIIVGAIGATGAIEKPGPAKWVGFMAIVLASANIFGGFVVTERMLRMFGASSKSPGA